MKTVKELRCIVNDLKIQEVRSSIKYFKKNNIDWNVYLPSRNKNLQRDFVWNIDQKRELIWSILLERHIPHVALINIIDTNNPLEEIFLVIDGKQRLSTMIDFTDDKFTLVIDSKEYLFSELPNDYQVAINMYYFKYYVANENSYEKITDEQKINWFKLINFAGTPQDKEHINNLK